MAEYKDDDILISVSGKDADTGYHHVVPSLKLPHQASADHVFAANQGLYRLIVTPLQNAATKAAKDGKDVRQAVVEVIAAFKIDSAERSAPTVGNRKREIAREMIRAELAKRGKDTSDARVDANLAPFLKARAAAVDEAFAAWLETPYEVTKRKGGAAKPEGDVTTEDWAEAAE